MRMRTVIETGRKIAPIINANLSGLEANIEAFRQLMEDLAVVKTESGRTAMLEQCVAGLARFSDALATVSDSWRSFDDTLGCYKYQFDRKKHLIQDMPGQQVMDFAVEELPSALEDTREEAAGEDAVVK